MATELFIPQLGQTVEEVTIVRWLLPEGTKVSQGQEILEVETDKAIFPVEANGKGYLHLGPYKEGQVVPVLTVVAVIGEQADEFTSGSDSGNQAVEIPLATASASQPPPYPPPSGGGNKGGGVQPSPEVGKVFVSPRAKILARDKGVNLSKVTPTGGSGARIAERDVIAYLSQAPVIETKPQLHATPVAQRVAAAAGLDLQAVAGTGPGGRIVKEDVQRAMQPESTRAPIQTPPVGEMEVLERIPLKGIRAIIADRMGTSVHTTARVTLVTEVDATQFVDVRNRLKERVEKAWGFAPGYNDLLAKIVALALRKYPYMNARLTKDANVVDVFSTIERLSNVNLGMAVDTDRGLIVPVIRDADHKRLQEFGTEFRAKIEQARQGRSLPDDLSGGTFTITNLGMYDVDAFTPVINLPEAAILGVGRIAPKPVVYKGAVAVRQMLTLSLAFDHRVVDGAPAARFLQYIKQVIEEPYLMITN